MGAAAVEQVAEEAVELKAESASRSEGAASFTAVETGATAKPAAQNTLTKITPDYRFRETRGANGRFSLMQAVKEWDRQRRGYRMVKRTFDIVFSACVIIVALIPSLILMVAICLESPGSPIYKQKRIGRTHRDGSVNYFDMYKFRSMYADADQRLEELMQHNEVQGAMFKMKDDPRVTRIGKFIRKHSIDEFPQFVNVFLGQMSVVGPRPPLPREVEQYTPYDLQRLAVKPGLTGPWQVGGRSDLDFEDMVELDLKYIASRSPLNDLRLIVRTIAVVFNGDGAA